MSKLGLVISIKKGALKPIPFHSLQKRENKKEVVYDFRDRNKTQKKYSTEFAIKIRNQVDFVINFEPRISYKQAMELIAEFNGIHYNAVLHLINRLNNTGV